MDTFNLDGLLEHLGINDLDLFPTYTEDGEETKWLRNWNNDDRVMIIMHEDVAAAAPTSNVLGVRTSTEVSKSTSEEYTKHIVYTRAVAKVSLKRKTQTTS